MNDSAEAAMSGHKPAFLQRYWAEIFLFLAIALAGGLMAFQHDIFGRDIVISARDDQAGLAFSTYSDKVNDGASVIRTSRPLQWDCSVREGFSLPYCAYEIVLDGNGAVHGANLTNMESIELVLDYKGPPTTFRFNLKNEDARYSTHGDRGTSKVNRSEFSIQPGRNVVTLHKQDFSVAEWWLNQHHVTPELARTQFDDIVAIEFVTGSLAATGEYAFSLDSLRLVRSTVSAAELYLAILGLLVASISFYAFIRIRRSRIEARERERLEAVARQALADAKLAAEHASEAKSEFLASMNHEIRTPLNAVLGYAQLLERADLAEKQMNAVKVIRRSGNHLLNLVTDILDISKIEAGKMELNCAPCDLRTMVHSVVDMMRAPAEQKGLSLFSVVAEEAPQGIEVDSKRLRQVLLNLLGNAVKFTSAGRVSLIVSQLSRAADSVTLRFEVQDSGAGIAPDDLPRIFLPFEQVGHLDQREGGTGLGLTITRRILGLMDSDMQVESRLGQGSNFWFDVTLPMAEAEATEASINAAEIGGYAGRRRHVLIVDDVEPNREMLGSFLGQIGFECSLARNGAEALQAAQKRTPDFVLMDLKMPVMDGFEATRIMRMIDTLRAVPVIVLSANIAEESAEAATAAGANGFLSKPIDYGDLLFEIGRTCGIEWTAERHRAA